MSGKEDWAELSDDEDASGEENHKQEKHEDSTVKSKSPYIKKENDNNVGTSYQSNRKKHDLDRESIIEDLKKCKGIYKLILYNVSFDAKEQDIKNHYSGIKVPAIEKLAKGTFFVEFTDFDEAVKLVNFKETILKGRPIKIKLERDRKHQDFEANYYDNYYFSKKNMNYKPRHKVDYNRREQYTEECEDYGYDPKPSHGAKHEEKEKFEDEEDYDNYHGSQGPEVIYVKKESTERKPIGFIRREEKKISDTSEKIQPASSAKFNPFGEARPRDEPEIQKKKIDEKNDGGEKHFEKEEPIQKSAEKVTKNFSYEDKGNYEDQKIKKNNSSNDKGDYRQKKNYGGYHQKYYDNYENNKYYEKTSNKYYVPKETKDESKDYKKKDSFAEKNEKKAPPKKGTNETFNRFDVLQNN